MRALILLALVLLSGCTYGPDCGPDGIVVRYYEIRTCFWPEAPRPPQ